MPIAAMFMGIIVKMYFQQREHNPPHVHVEYGGQAAALSIETGKVIDGHLPPVQARIVSRWISRHRDALRSMWETQDFYRLPPVG